MKKIPVKELTLEAAANEFDLLSEASKTAQWRFVFSIILMCGAIFLCLGSAFYSGSKNPPMSPQILDVAAFVFGGIAALLIGAALVFGWQGSRLSVRRRLIAGAFDLTEIAGMPIVQGQLLGDQRVIELSATSIHLVAKFPFALQMVRKGCFLAGALLFAALSVYVFRQHGFVVHSQSGIWWMGTFLMWCLPFFVAMLIHFGVSSYAIQWFASRESCSIVIEQFRFARARRVVEIPMNQLTAATFDGGVFWAKVDKKKHALIRFAEIESNTDEANRKHILYSQLRCTRLFETVQEVTGWTDPISVELGPTHLLEPLFKAQEQ